LCFPSASSFRPPHQIPDLPCVPYVPPISVFSSSQWILHIFGDPNIPHYRVYSSQSSALILKKINPIHVLPLRHILIPNSHLRLGLPISLFLSRFLTNKLRISLLYDKCRISSHLIGLNLVALMIFSSPLYEVCKQACCLFPPCSLGFDIVWTLLCWWTAYFTVYLYFTLLLRNSKTVCSWTYAYFFISTWRMLRKYRVVHWKRSLEQVSVFDLQCVMGKFRYSKLEPTVSHLQWMWTHTTP
jgi:hypothetical protein